MSERLTRLEDWRFVGFRLYGHVQGHPRYEDGTAVALPVEKVAVASYLDEPDDRPPLHEGTELATDHMRYELGREALKAIKPYTEVGD